MRRLPILKMITHLVFVIAVVVLIFIVPAYIMLIVMPGTVPFKIKGEIAENLGAEELIVVFFAIVGYAFFVYALYLFRKVLDLFSRRKFFEDSVIRNFDQIGKALIIGGIISCVPAFVYNIMVNQKIEIGFEASIDSFLVVLGIGLFFIVLSEVFLTARNMKEENDLTV